MEYHFRIHQEGHIYWAECIELEDCLVEALTHLELLDNMHETLNLHLEEPESPRKLFPLPRKKVTGVNIVKVSVKPQIAWVTMLRHARLSRGWTQLQAARALDIRNVYVYQKLESSKTANPTLATMVKMKSVFPELKLDIMLG